MLRIRLSFVVILAVLACSKVAVGKPNVLLIISDDLNRHLAVTGYEQVPTPALSRLAQTGMRLKNLHRLIR